MDWTTQIRSALRDHLATGITVYRVGQDAGISVGRLHEFVVDEKKLNRENTEKLANYLGFRLTRKRPQNISKIG